MFTSSGDLNRWTRQIPEEGTSVVGIINEDNLRLEIAPTVSQYIHHAEKRIAAGVYFEIAAKYAEKCDGQIKQLSNVQGCTEGGVAEHVLAVYPSMPLMWEQVCKGFQETLNHSHEHD